MNYDDMPAGPEMDLAIRRNVMRWDERHADRMYGIATNFRPSFSIADAWEVAEKLSMIVFPNEGHWVAAVTRGGYVDHGEHWVDDSVGYATKADTAPLAICRAALKAVGE